MWVVRGPPRGYQPPGRRAIPQRIAVPHRRSVIVLVPMTLDIRRAGGRSNRTPAAKRQSMGEESSLKIFGGWRPSREPFGPKRWAAKAWARCGGGGGPVTAIWPAPFEGLGLGIAARSAVPGATVVAEGWRVRIGRVCAVRCERVRQDLACVAKPGHLRPPDGRHRRPLGKDSAR